MLALFRSYGFWMVNFANFTDSIAYFGILGLLTLFLQQDLHFSEVASGQTVGLLTGGVGLCMLFGGSICDFLGVRRAIITSVAVSNGRARTAGLRPQRIG